MAMKRKRLNQDASRMGQRLLALLLAVAGFVSTGPAQTQPAARPLIEPFSMREDFQGDSLGQWASYPPPQDIGYEPSLSPTSDFGAPGGRSLMRVVRPNRAGPLRFGFIKRQKILMAEGTRLSFTYQLRSPASDDFIEIGLAGRDGYRYTTKIPATADKWTTAEIRLTELRNAKAQGPLAGLEIDAIYLVAHIANANPDLNYRFMIDDIALSAAHYARFSLRSPEAAEIEPWRALNAANGYRLGESISIKAAAPALLTRAESTLKIQDGPVVSSTRLYDDGTHGDERAGDGVWSNNSLYTFRASDPAGLWLVELLGTTPDGHVVNTAARFIVHAANAGGHPRLLFGARDRDALVARTSNPKAAALWSKLQTVAKNSRETGDLANGGETFTRLNRSYLLPTLLGYFDVLSRARARISSNAFDAYITGDPQSLAAAKSAMLAVARWRTWTPPWFEAHGQHTYYPAGELAFDMALGYDLLYEKLSEDERALVRRALIERAIVPTYKEYVVDNRAMADTSNWIAHTVGGALFAASAITGDGPASESDGRLELYTNGLLQKFESHLLASYLPDGSYGEGISYQEFDLESTGPVLTALQRIFGIDYWKHSNVLRSLSYPFYILAKPTSESLDTGDSHPPSGRTIAPLVKNSRDPTLRWYYDQFEHSSIIDFIFFDDSVAPRAPSLPTSRVFSDKGNAVFRSGWGPDDLVFLYRAGPTFNHNHSDQGSFLLTAFGESLVTEGGWSDYYKDPYYATYFTQAVGHNTVLVDGNPESQAIADTPQFVALNDYPRITDSITSEFYDGVGSELSSVYQTRLARYVRRLIFVKPYYFVVFDDLKVNGKAAQFDFLLHLPDRDKIKTEGLTAVYNGAKASLAVQMFAPSLARLSVEDGRIPYHVLATRTPAETPALPAYLDFKTVNLSSETQFLTAMVPAKNESTAQLLIKQMTEIVGQNLKGIRVERGDEVDLVMFRIGAETQTIRQGEWSAEAATLAITQRANKLEVFALQSARLLRRGNQILFSSESPTSVAIHLNDDEMEMACNTERATKITLFTGKLPMRVLLDGKELSGNTFRFNRLDGTISLDIPGRQHDLKIMFR
jgi:hypothetical protein